MTDSSSSVSSSSSILTTLGAGSGIDTKTLVSQLVAAQFDSKTKALSNKNDTLTAQLSALSQIKSSLTTFSSSLATLIAGGTLSTQPVSANSSVVAASLLPLAHLQPISSDLDVKQLATAQVLSGAGKTLSTDPVGTGKLTIKLGTATYDSNGVLTGFAQKAGTTAVDVTIDAAHNSLDGIASAINAANAGVTATVIRDASGARLSLKGATGAQQAFTIDVAEDAGAPGLSALAFNTTTKSLSVARQAQDSIVALDGVTMTRPTNSLTDVIPGVRLDLVKADPGNPVAITSQRPTAALTQAAQDFVSAYNQVHSLFATDTDPKNGVLYGDSGLRSAIQQLGQLTSQPLVANAAAGVPNTLAELGIQTERDGTLSLDTTKFNTAMSAAPDAVEAIFTQGVGKALSSLVTNLTGTNGVLTISQNVYTAQQKTVANDQAKLQTDSASMTDRLTQQYAGMDARVSAYKATQSFLDQQIKAWAANG